MSLSRQIIFAIDPEIGLAATYSYLSVPDFNIDAKLVTAVHIPATKTGEINPMQETVFFGTMGVGKVFQSFIDDLALDGEEDVESELVTARLDPSLIPDGRVRPEVGSKRLIQLYFPSYNVFDNAESCEYVIDNENPRDGAVWLPFLGTNSNRRSFKSGLGRWFHLRILSKNLNPATIILSSFKVIFYNLQDREKEG